MIIIGIESELSVLHGTVVPQILLMNADCKKGGGMTALGFREYLF